MGGGGGGGGGGNGVIPSMRLQVMQDSLLFPPGFQTHFQGGVRTGLAQRWYTRLYKKCVKRFDKELRNDVPHRPENW